MDILEFLRKLKEISEGLEETQDNSVDIHCPPGYEVDEEKSTFKKVVFKKKESKGWDSIDRITGWYINTSSEILDADCVSIDSNRNVFPLKSQAEGVLALAQLLQLKKAVDPEWNSKYVIRFNRTLGEFKVNTSKDYSGILSFSSKEIAEKFLDDHKKLIESAVDFL